MPTDNSFQELMERVQKGDQDAARRIVDEFFRRLIGLARTRLDGAILQKEGPEEIVNSALKSFFKRQATKPFELASWESLWGLLATITLRKCGHRVEYYLAQCRDIRRDWPQPDPPPGEDPATPWQAIARGPTPAEAAMLRDTMSQLLGELDERDRTIVHLILDGWSVPEISEKVGRSEYLIRRVLARIRRRWQRLCQ
jgi:RNA polymerase sigma factor (sigma-70 family)